MNFKDITYEIESHPLVTAIVIFLVLFLGMKALKGNSTAIAPTLQDNTSLPKTNDTYYQQYNSFPIATPNPTSGTSTTQPTTGPTSSQLVTVTSGQIADKPGGTNNTSGGTRGKNLINAPKGALISLLGGPVTFNGQHYYHVMYKSITGYINAKTVGLS